MKKRISSLLLAVVMVLSMTTGALAAEESSDFVAVKTTANAGIVTLTVSAKQETKNGKLTLSYDAERLEYTGAEFSTDVSSAKAEDGTVTMGYAVSTADTLRSGDTIAVLRFRMLGSWTSTTLKLSVVNFNGDAGLNADALAVSLLRSSGSSASGEDETEEPDTDILFTDVPAWCEDAIRYVTSKGYFKGITTTEFGPDVGMTRAMFVTVLGRMAGVDPEGASNTAFTDVVKDSFYEGYVAWGHENGIVKGTTETTFGPNELVTRAQMAVFLYRYAAYAGKDVSAGTDLSAFADGASVGAWSRSAVEWAVAMGVIQGTAKGLEPAATATRAQVAMVIYRFDTLVK